MKVPLLDLKAQYLSIKDEIDRAVAEVFDSQYFIGGKQVGGLEKAIADYCRAGYATGVTSGTDALLVSLMIEGIGAGDEVIVPDYSFFATAGCVSRLGATPVFVDIDPVTYNIDTALIEAGCGTVVLLSSDLSSHGTQNIYVAAASGTVIAFAKSFGCEVAADGVCVNCLATRPPVNPEWVAQTVSFLASDGHYYAGQVMFLSSDN